MADEDKRKAYAQLIQNRNRKKEEYQSLDNEDNELINYANEHRDEYDQLQEGHTADEITQDEEAEHLGQARSAHKLPDALDGPLPEEGKHLWVVLLSTPFVASLPLKAFMDADFSELLFISGFCFLFRQKFIL